MTPQARASAMRRAYEEFHEHREVLEAEGYSVKGVVLRNNPYKAGAKQRITVSVSEWLPELNITKLVTERL